MGDGLKGQLKAATGYWMLDAGARCAQLKAQGSPVKYASLSLCEFHKAGKAPRLNSLRSFSAKNLTGQAKLKGNNCW